MSLTQVLDEIGVASDDARNAANQRVQNTLRAHGWMSRDDGAGLVWAHERVHGLTSIVQAVDIQCVWDAKLGFVP